MRWTLYSKPIATSLHNPIEIDNSIKIINVIGDGIGNWDIKRDSKNIKEEQPDDDWL